NLNKNFTTNL
ncbi:formyl transferase family protein, partial [Chlamydia psittaci 84-8471/1]